MGTDPAGAGRADAIWAMGETEDPRFLPFLTACFADGGAALRPAVLRSLTRIRRRLRAWSHAGELALSVCRAIDAEDGTRNVVVALSSTTAEDMSAVKPTHFAILEQGMPVSEYTVTAQPNVPLLAVGFAMPRIVSRADPYSGCLDKALDMCLQLKRKGDFWCIDRYSIDSGSGDVDAIATICVPPPADPALAPHFTKHHGFATDAAVLRKVIPGTVPRERTARDVMAGLERLFQSACRVGGSRHVFLFIDPDSAGRAGKRHMQELIHRAEGYNIAVHGVVPDPACRPTPLHELCAATPGGSVNAAPLEQMPQLLADLYRGLLNRHEITYRSPAPPGEVTEVKVCSPLGCGSAVVRWAEPPLNA